MTNKSQHKTAARIARHARIRARVIGTAERPRLAVFRSNKFLYAQLINDADAKTITAADTRTSKAATPADRAVELGKTIADAAKAAKIDTVVFDRGGFLYAGAIKAFADSARENGLTF
jgi:large subunit ribosomal protein L18